MRMSRKVGLALLGMLSVASAACGQGGARSATAAKPGTYGQSYLVTVSRPAGGTITSSDGQLYCGTAAAASRCGPATYAWDAPATLTATPDAGYMFGTWAGDCTGRKPCVLSTATYGADKTVAAVFGPPGRTAHENFTDPGLHGPQFLAFAAKQADSFDCAYCHGASYAGMGLAPSCNDCHARAGAPGWQTRCDFCHGAPPPPSATTSTAIHPAVSSDLTTCAMCHPGTVTAAGAIVAGGKHMNGVVEATGGGHLAGFDEPSTHAPEFFAYVSGTGGLDCKGCHGQDYGTAIANGQSCNSCHVAAGWTGWTTNCSFCHGLKSAATQQGGYDVAANATFSAPPDDLAQRLSGSADAARTGAHAKHLTGSAIAKGFRCETCHAVPTGLAHIGGRSARATVTLSGANQGTLPSSLGTYDPTSGTCTTRCHGTVSPPWASTQALACDGCHGAPPATSAHAAVTAGDLARCEGCHPETMNADGSIDLAGGKHLDGAVQSQGHLAGFAAPAVHGPQFLAFLGGAANATDCRSCHGASYTSCTGCHSANGWASWQTNCTFCHGTRKQTYAAGDLALAAPPDAVSERLDGIAQPTRAGKHAQHLARYACATCHAVPSGLSHVSGASGRATVALAAVGALPAGTYDAATGTCTTYCHGSTLLGGSVPKPAWSSLSSAMACSSCHGAPPPSPAHAAVGADLTRCAGCHAETMGAAGTLLPGGKHLDGAVQAAGHAAGFAAAPVHGKEFLNSLTGTTSTCESCHGASLASCETCHSANGWVSWKTNCTFCHGTKTKAYGGDLALAAPADAVIQRLGISQDGVPAENYPTGTAPWANRIGRHDSHKSRMACAVCHSVPTDLSHVHGTTARGALTYRNNPVIDGKGIYAQGYQWFNCTNSCHTNLNWDANDNQCGACHDLPPQSGASSAGTDFIYGANMHESHIQDAVEWGAYQGVCDAWGSGAGCDSPEICTDCHSGNTHLDGVTDVGFGGKVQGTWNTSTKTCSNVNCHDRSGARGWY